MKNKPSCHTFCDYLATESGLLKISANDEAITAIAFVEQQDEPSGSTPLLFGESCVQYLMASPAVTLTSLSA